MGFLDGVKAKAAAVKANATELDASRGVLLLKLTVHYMGGYSELAPAAHIPLVFYANQVEFCGVAIPMSQIVDVATEGKEEVSRRVTVTRLLLVGIFAFALKKKKTEKESYVTIVMGDGQEVVFRVDGKSPLELKGMLAQVASRVRCGAARVTPPPPPPVLEQ